MNGSQFACRLTFAITGLFLVSVADAWTCVYPESPPSDGEIKGLYEWADIVVMATLDPRDPFLSSPTMFNVEKAWKGRVPPAVAIRGLVGYREGVIFATGPGEDGAYNAVYLHSDCVELRDRSFLERKLIAIYGIGSGPDLKLDAQVSSWFLTVLFLSLIGLVGFAGFLSPHLMTGL